MAENPTLCVIIYSCDAFSVDKKLFLQCLQDIFQQTWPTPVQVYILAPDTQQRDALQASCAASYAQCKVLCTHEAKPELLYTAEYTLFIAAPVRLAPVCFMQLATRLQTAPAAIAAYSDCYCSPTDKDFENWGTTEILPATPYDSLELLRCGNVGPVVLCRSQQLTHLPDPRWQEQCLLAFCLQLSEQGPLCHCPKPLYLAVAPEKFLQDTQQRQYDIEYKLREAALIHFLRADYQWREPLAPMLQIHTLQVSHLIQQAYESDKVKDADILDKHIFAYTLLTAKGGNTSAALDVLNMYFSLVDRSISVCHLYRLLLATAPGAAPALSPPVPPVDAPPVVSVIIPLHNQGQYLEEALRSVIAQTLPRWELLIIDDGSTDASGHMAKKLLATLNDPRLRLVSQLNQGKGKTRNRGLRETSAPYVCILDADDRLCPEYFAVATALLDADPDAGWVCPKTITFGAEAHLVWTEPYDFISSLHTSTSPVTSVYRRAIWEELGGYREDMVTSEDWEFWIRAGEEGWQGAMTEQVLFIYRHAFQRFGNKQDVNILRKQQYLAHHPWWYRQCSSDESIAALTAYNICKFPEDFLDSEAVHFLQKKLSGNKSARQKTVMHWKSMWEQSHIKNPPSLS